MLKIEKLSKYHKKDNFNCGNSFLNVFIKKYAFQNQKRYFIGTTYVISDENNNIIAYVTLSVTSIKKESIEEKKPYDELPVLLIARLAVDKNYQGKGLGKELLKFSITKALGLSEDLGCIGIVVDSKPEAVNFYSQFGFVEIETIPKTYTTKMFLPIKTIKKIQKS
jgi:predicted N-acetyltransferase YhbS